MNGPLKCISFWNSNLPYFKNRSVNNECKCQILSIMSMHGPRAAPHFTHKRKIVVYTFRGLVQTRHHGQVLWLHLTFPLSAISWQSQTERSVFDTHMQLFEITKNDNAIFTCYILSGKLSCMDRVIGTLRLLGFLVGHCYLGGMHGVCDILN